MLLGVSHGISNSEPEEVRGHIFGFSGQGGGLPQWLLRYRALRYLLTLPLQEPSDLSRNPIRMRFQCKMPGIVVAPDLPGFGFSDSPPRSEFKYTFENLARVIGAFTTSVGLKRFAIYIFDYGAPVGLRLAFAHPEQISAIISQNGNAYEEGLSEGWNPIQNYWKEPSAANREALRDFLKPEATKWQYTHGVTAPSLAAPESYTLDSALLARHGNDEIQLDLFLDYASNVALYPKFQEYFRKECPPLLAVWGLPACGGKGVCAGQPKG
jgi:hypothetical protein